MNVQPENVQLVSADQPAIYTISHSDWNGISDRVEAALSLKNIISVVEKTLPNVKELLRVSERWNTYTFPALKAQAEKIVSTALTSTTAYQLIANIIATLDPNQPLPPEKASEIHGVLQDLSPIIESLNQDVSAVEVEIADFVAVNAETDRHLGNIRNGLGPDWNSIAAESQVVNRASGLIGSAWRAVSSDTRALADGTIRITTTFLLGLAIQSAILGWQNLSKECSDFIGAINASLLARRVVTI